MAGGTDVLDGPRWSATSVGAGSRQVAFGAAAVDPGRVVVDDDEGLGSTQPGHDSAALSVLLVHETEPRSPGQAGGAVAEP